MKKTYTTEIKVTVPAGKFCKKKGYECRFLQTSYNHPIRFCFLIPDSEWPDRWDAEFPKHPKCPSLLQPERLTGEEAKVMTRLEIYKDLTIRG